MSRHGVEREAESPWVKLRRRKVVQWGLAYAAGAWVVLQFVGFAADAFAWPSMVKQLALLGLTVGFPVVLTLAWFHGERGQQRVTGPEFLVLAALLLLGGGLLWIFGQRSATTTAITDKSTATPIVTDTRPSIAVLPFENRSGAADDAFFVDGIHDDILTQLSKVSALRVISRTSVERFRESDQGTKEIARQLGVRNILEGGVQRAGDRVRINVQLIDVPTDAPVWSETYDRELAAPDIFAIQSELAATIAGKLKASLTAAEQARAKAIPTRSLEAWEAYQRGRQRLLRRNTQSISEAEGQFRNAIAQDSTFALAWDGLADALVLQVYYSSQPKSERLRAAEQAVNRALELEPDLAEGWASAGVIAYQRFELERSEQMLRRAIALNPNYAPAYHWLSMSLSDLGRRQEALAMAESAVMLDPLSGVINNWLGNARERIGRFDDALVAFRQAIEIEPTMALPYVGVGQVYAYGFGRFDRGLPWYQKASSVDPGNPFVRAFLAKLYWELGDDAESARWLTRALELSQGDVFTNLIAAVLYVERGDMKAAHKHAQVAADLDPWALFLLRNEDLRTGDYASARARYAKVFPGLLTSELPAFKEREASAAIDLAVVLQHTGEGARAGQLLDRAEAYFQAIPRMGVFGSGYSDVRILALRGEKAKALAALRQAEQEHCRDFWRYYRDVDPALTTIRNEPEFKAVFADIEREMTRQRAALAARPENALPAPTEPGA